MNIIMSLYLVYIWLIKKEVGDGKVVAGGGKVDDGAVRRPPPDTSRGGYQ